jgi:hypothetical protein
MVEWSSHTSFIIIQPTPGASNIPKLCINGEIVFVSGIPPENKIRNAKEERL